MLYQDLIKKSRPFFSFHVKFHSIRSIISQNTPYLSITHFLRNIFRQIFVSLPKILYHWNRITLDIHHFHSLQCKSYENNVDYFHLFFEENVFFVSRVYFIDRIMLDITSEFNSSDKNKLTRQTVYSPITFRKQVMNLYQLEN